MHAIKEKLLPMGLLCLLAILTGAITGVITAGFGRILLEIERFARRICSGFFHFAIGRCVDGLGLSEVWKREQSGNGLDFRCCDRKSRPYSIAADSTIDRQHLADASLRRQCRTRGGCRAAGCNGRSLDRKPYPFISEAKSLIRILTISGMAAGFSGLFHAPLAAVCFALEVLVVGKLEYRALLPAALSAITANIVSIALGLETFQVTLPETVVSPISISMLILGVAAGLTGGVFTFLLKQAKQAAANGCQIRFFALPFAVQDWRFCCISVEKDDIPVWEQI